MYRLLLLDDEEIVIKGIQKVYDMPKYGFAVAGAFTSPLKAAEQLDSLKPDLVITDVKMPRMDGLEFASLVKKWNPETEVVILSGYDDFSYAQAAVKLGISDYLLKPIKRLILWPCWNGWRQKSGKSSPGRVSRSRCRSFCRTVIRS